MVKTKIVCTLGPSSGNVRPLRNMMLAGMDVVRLNFSHATHKQHLHHISLIRELNKKYRRHIRILQDLEGFRIRIGRFKGKDTIRLKKKQMVLLSNKKGMISKDIIPFDYPGKLSDIKTGSFVYIDDGNICLKIRSRGKNYLKAEVVTPGLLKEHKGINIPDAELKFRSLTEKDKTDLEFGIDNKVDFIAQSFVRNKRDMLNIRRFIESRDKKFHPRLIAKIENRDGIKNIDKILDVSDGIMIARGDMGVSLPIYEVPIVQKMLIKKCLRRKKFVITATQMLESMTDHIRPTRAEVSDVANAILDGSDYLMLSGETAIGTHPVETVKMMNSIIKFTEQSVKRSS